jgi:hypothetical protein
VIVLVIDRFGVMVTLVGEWGLWFDVLYSFVDVEVGRVGVGVITGKRGKWEEQVYLTPVWF